MESGRLLEEGKQKYPIGEIVTSFSSCNAHRKACSSTAAGQARRRGRGKSLARARGKEGEGEESGEERGGELGRGKEGERGSGDGSGGRRGKFEGRRDAAAGPFVIDSGQYGCAQVSLLLFVGRVTQAVAPASAHSCKVKTVGGPSTLSRPSIRSYVSLSLSRTLDNRSRRVARCTAAFFRPPLFKRRIDSPGYK